MKQIKVGKEISVWWNTGVVKNGQNMATILKILPYTGRYTEYFNCVLKLTSSTPRGFTEMAYYIV